MAANIRLMEIDTESRAFIDFLETEAFIGPMAVEPMSETKLADLYKLQFQPAYAGTKSSNFQDILQHMRSHHLLRQEGNQWIIPTKAIAVPYIEHSEKQLQPQRRRIVMDPRLSNPNLSRLVESRKGEPLSFLAANIKEYETNAGRLMEKANFPAVVILSNTGLGQEVEDEDLIWNGYSNFRRSGGGEDGDLMLYYASHLKVDNLQDLQLEQNEMLWVKLTEMFKTSKGMKERVLIMGYFYGWKIGTGDFLRQFKQNLEIIKERFGDVDVVVQGSVVEMKQNFILKLFAYKGSEECGLVSHEVGEGKLFLTSPGVAFRSVKVLDDERETGFEAVLAHMDKTNCELCRVEFLKYSGFKEHLNTPRHHRNHFFNIYQRKPKELLKNPHCFGLEMSILNGDPGVEMSPDESGLVLVQTSPGVTKNFSVSMKNTSGGMEQLEDGSKVGIVIQAIYFLRTDPAFKVTDKYKVSNRKKGEASKKIRVPFGRSYKAQITCLSTQRGYYKVPLVITFYHDLRSNKITQENEERFELSHMVLEILLNVETDEDMFKKVTLTEKQIFNPEDPLENKFRLAARQYLSVSGRYASRIESIDCVENSILMEKFEMKKNEFKSMGKGVKEYLLFHGTKDVNVESILRENFRMDYAGQHGLAYGRGIYFSEETEIPNKYMNKEKRSLLLCRVLLGNKFLSKEREIPVGFDSKLVGTIIVIKDVDQILPCFVINLAPTGSPP